MKEISKLFHCLKQYNRIRDILSEGASSVQLILPEVLILFSVSSSERIYIFCVCSTALPTLPVLGCDINYYYTGCIKKVDNFETALNVAKRLEV